jgi:hypothetical protein
MKEAEIFGQCLKMVISSDATTQQSFLKYFWSKTPPPHKRHSILNKKALPNCSI